MIRTIHRESPELQNHIYLSPYHITETIKGEVAVGKVVAGKANAEMVC
jgi:hypothetical protein